MGTGFMAAMALIMLAIPGTLAGLFIDRANPANAEVAELAVSFLIIAALFQVADGAQVVAQRSEEHTSELQSLMRISYAVFCLKKKKKLKQKTHVQLRRS